MKIVFRYFIALVIICCAVFYMTSCDAFRGKSAYEIAVENGFVGTESEWLATLTGEIGHSAYEVAVENGFVGSKSDWLASLQGIQGKKGDTGAKGDRGIGVASVYVDEHLHLIVVMTDGQKTDAGYVGAGKEITTGELKLNVSELNLLEDTFFVLEASRSGIFWKSENPDVAQVANNGLVVGISEGSTVITAETIDGEKVSCAVSVVNFDLKKNADGEYIVNGYNGYAENLVIPSTIKGIPVSEIGGSAFFNNSTLKSVTLPNSIKSIGNTAFACCSQLTSVTLGDSVVSIDDAAFSNCPMLSSINLPNSLTELGASVFNLCSSLESISIPSGVTEYRGSLFSSCTSLKSITIGNTVTLIDMFAFYGCTSLKSVTIPLSVLTIGENAFANCKALSEVVFMNTGVEVLPDAFRDTLWIKMTIPPQNDDFVEVNDVVTVSGTESLLLRKLPSVDGVADATAAKGTKLTRIAVAGYWSKILYEGNIRYAASKYLLRGELAASSGAPEFTPTLEKVAIANPSGLSLRSYPSLDAGLSTVEHYPEFGTELIRIGIYIEDEATGYGWSQVVYNGGVYYASNRYLELK